jgi:hypothetical protein
MKINPQRLLNGLGSQGFQFAYSEEEWSSFVLVRAHTNCLFEQIRIGQGSQRGGRVGDQVEAGVQCAIVPGRTALKGMAEYVPLTEIASDVHTGWTKLVTQAEAIAWESKLIEAAPIRATELANQVGDALLSRTGEARGAANQYLARCAAVGSTPQEMLNKLTSQADQFMLHEAKRIVSRPIVCIPDGALFYQVAALAISLFSEEIEGDKNWLVGREPDAASEEDRGLMVRLQVMASRLACEPGWKEKSAMPQ